jgi:succinyl-diaminopimelate desuccinylase
LEGARPGKTLIFSGHLDTYPVGDTAKWTVPALEGCVSDDMTRLYGRGAADMKGGIAASIIAVRAMAEQKDAWSGQIVLALAGDEETMGSLGTMWLLDNVDVVKNADAVVVGDAGSPLVVRTGEKGLLWLEVCAIGKAAHGAHVHRGVNAIEKLMGAIGCIRDLEKLDVQGPDEVAQAIEAATPISEEFAGAGEANVLRQITVNLGTISGGTSMNLIPDFAQAKLDIRLPYGITTDELLRHIRNRLDPLQGISFHVVQHYDPTWTSRSEDIVRCTLSAAQDVIDPKAVINMRVGASDARLYRQRGIPTVVVGLTPFNMGGPDEYCLIEELLQVAQVHALTALHFLKQNQ